ncbi:MAG: T9SS type A sorting domain-containing protein [bacterium]
MKTLFFTLFLICSVFLTGTIIGQNTVYQPTAVRLPLYFDVSPPLRDMISIAPTKKEEGLKEVPNKIGRKEYFGIEIPPFTLPEDPVWQKHEGTYQPSSPVPIQNFEGISNISGLYPPDPQGEIGPNHFVQVVNSNFAIYSRTGTLLFGPASLSTIWNGIPDPWNGTNNGDPVVLYDQAANRWLISQFSLPNSTQYAELVAISQTGDPTGSWYRYVYEFGSEMPDYPKFGVWPDGYYLSVNQFTGGSTWGGVSASALERNKMLAGDPSALAIFFDLGPSGDPESMLPSDWDGSASPPVNSPNYFTYFNNWSSPPNCYLKIWEFHVNWVTPANSTFSLATSLTTSPFDSEICPAFRGRCIPQPSTLIKLESLSDRLMYRQQYRNFTTHQTIVNNHTVDVDGTGHAGIRWYELRNTGSGWSIYQQGTYAPDAYHRWVGSLAMNTGGDIGLGYSVSDGSTIYPGIRYTGRRASDPLGTMTTVEQTVISGSGSQTGPASRWGDYSGMSVDPVDDNTFWYTTEYIQTTGSSNWKTRIASFVLNNVPTVVTLPASAITQSSATLNGTVNPNGFATSYHFDWGTTTGYGNSTPAGAAGSGTTPVPVLSMITGLAGGTIYHFRLVGVNADGTSYGLNQSFTTLCGSYTIPFFEGFTNTTIPPCWSQIDHQGNGEIWNFGVITTQSPNPALTGNYAFLDSDAYGSGHTQNADLVSPTLDLSAYSSVTLSFLHYFLLYIAESGTVSYSINNGSSWTPIQSFTTTSPTNPATFSQVIPAVAGQAQVKFKWNYTGTWGYSWAIDNVQLTGIPTNRSLTNVTVGQGVTSCYDAGQTITVAGNGTTFTVQNGGSATLIAGQNILFLPGTTVQPGGYLRGYITQNGQFCTNPTTAPQNPVILEVINMDTVSALSLFKVYPNPTTGKFTLELSPELKETQTLVTIYGMMGERVLKKVIQGVSKMEFSLLDKPAGVYIIHVMSGKHSEAAKVIRK